MVRGDPLAVVVASCGVVPAKRSWNVLMVVSASGVLLLTCLGLVVECSWSGPGLVLGHGLGVVLDD